MNSQTMGNLAHGLRQTQITFGQTEQLRNKDGWDDFKNQPKNEKIGFKAKTN